MTHLRFDGLRRSFGAVRVLRGVSGQVEAERLLLVTGHNGSGKSTLLRCLAGLLAPDRGTIDLQFDGRQLDTAQRRQAVGYLAPDLSFYDELSTLENLQFFAKLRQVPKQRASSLLARVGLPENRAAGALSSGMRQRLRWCFALLAEPPVLLLDEPFQNLDAPGIEVGREMLAEHLRKGLAVVANPASLDLPDVEEHLDLGG